MVLTLSQLELGFLCWLSTCLLLLPWPVPRGWALPGIALVAVQTLALMSIHSQGEVLSGSQDGPHNHADTFADVLGVFVVPALGGALVVVVMWHLARANARLRRRLRAQRGWTARSQAIGSDMPTGWGAAAGEGSCMTGSSIGDSATSPRAA